MWRKQSREIIAAVAVTDRRSWRCDVTWRDEFLHDGGCDVIWLYVSPTPNYFHTCEFPWCKFTLYVQYLLNGCVHVVLISSHATQLFISVSNQRLYGATPHGVPVIFGILKSELISVAMITSKSKFPHLLAIISKPTAAQPCKCWWRFMLCSEIDAS